MSDLFPPKVSVCIPVYNGSDYIAESIASVLGQTYRAFELIVCDNCSTDDTGEIVRGFDDTRIRYIRNPVNLGLVGNANRCLELADGEYICVLHHDDLMMRGNLEQKVRLLENYPDVGFVHSNILLIDSKGEVVSRNIWNEDSRRDYIEDGKKVFQSFLSYLPLGASIFIGAVLARRACYHRLGGFRTELAHCNDSEMWMRMLLFYDVACIGEPLVKYRVHPASTSSSWGDYASLDYLREHFVAAQMIFERYGNDIPDADHLNRRVEYAFGEQALKWGYKAMSEGNFDTGRACLNEARNMCPSLYKNFFYWKAAARLSAGAAGLRFYNAIRRR